MNFRHFWAGLIACALAVFPGVADAGGKMRASAAKMHRQTVKFPSYKMIKVRAVEPNGGRIDEDLTQVPLLRSQAVLVLNKETGDIIYSKNADQVQPIASITKLMTAVTVLDSAAALDEVIRIEAEDMDFLRRTKSRLRLGEVLRRSDLLRLALMASENRAAAALGRSHPGGLSEFVAAMNHKAAELGMSDSRFADPTGLSSDNVSSPRDLAKLVAAAAQYPLLREYSTTPSVMLTQLDTGREIRFVNTNVLVRNGEWEINLSKTGYISESGQCLVMDAKISGTPMVIVLLDSVGRMSRIADANRLRKWLENSERVLSLPRNDASAT